MAILNYKTKVRGITKNVHPSEMAEFFVTNASKIRSAVVLVDYVDDEGKTKTNERYIGDWETGDLAWWIACLQNTLMKQM